MRLKLLATVCLASLSRSFIHRGPLTIQSIQQGPESGRLVPQPSISACACSHCLRLRKARPHNSQIGSGVPEVAREQQQRHRPEQESVCGARRSVSGCGSCDVIAAIDMQMNAAPIMGFAVGTVVT